jgi:hypothetical protein
MEYEEFEKLKEKEIGEQNEILAQTDKDQDYITYFPLNEKYISLYIKTEMPEEVLAKRELLREKAHKLKQQKMGVKRREMKLADKVDDEVTGDKYDQKKPRGGNNIYNLICIFIVYSTNRSIRHFLCSI